jgi:hypothetical protein
LCVWMNMIQDKPIGEGSGNCVETFDNEVHIDQCAPLDGPTMRAQTPRRRVCPRWQRRFVTGTPTLRHK